MAGTGTKRIIELTEASTVQSGDYIAVDSNARGTKKVPTDTLATSAALTAETNARAGADEQMSERMDGIEEQTALIQNPTKTLSGALAHFTDGANMPMVACTASIVPKQSGTGTPSPDNVRPISGWESVVLTKAGESPLKPSEARTETLNGITFESDGNGNYHLYGTATASVESPIYHIDEFTIPLSSDGWSVYFNNTEANANVNVHFMSPTNTIVDSWGMYELRRINSSYSAMGGKQCAGLRFYVKVDEIVDMWLSPLFLKRADITTITTSLGRTVYGGTLDVVSGVLTAYPFYPSYNGETLDGRWICDRAVYAEGTTPPTGSQVALISGTSTTYQLTPTEVNTLLGENNVWADSGDIEITYRRDISIVINNLESALNG